MLRGDDQLLRELHAGLEVVKSQQSEINRRLGKIEQKLEEDIVDPARVSEIEEELSGRKSWWSSLLQSVVYLILATIAVAIGKTIGIEVAW